MFLGIPAEKWLEYIIQFATLATGFAVMWRTLTGRLDKESDERKQANAQAAIDATKEANEQVRVQNLNEIRRLDDRNKELDAANRERDGRIEALQAASVERIRLDVQKDQQIVEFKETIKRLEDKLELTSKDCKTEIEKVLAELEKVRGDLAEAIKSKDKAEERVERAEQAPGAEKPDVSVAAGTITLDVSPAKSGKGQVAEGPVELEITKKE